MSATHTPDFFVDESSLIIGVDVMPNLVIDYMGVGG